MQWVFQRELFEEFFRSLAKDNDKLPSIEVDVVQVFPCLEAVSDQALIVLVQEKLIVSQLKNVHKRSIKVNY